MPDVAGLAPAVGHPGGVDRCGEAPACPGLGLGGGSGQKPRSTDSSMARPSMVTARSAASADQSRAAPCSRAARIGPPLPKLPPEDK